MENLFVSVIIGLGSGTFIGIAAAVVYEHVLDKRIKGGGTKASATPPPIKRKDEEGQLPVDCPWR